MVRWAFDILGIEATRDKKQIKRAYAQLVRQYHPEEHPEEWARIHEAYQMALKYADMPGLDGGGAWRGGEAGNAGQPQDGRAVRDGSEAGNTGRPWDSAGDWDSRRAGYTGGSVNTEPEETLEEEPPQSTEVTENAEYGAMFQEEQSQWLKRKAEHERRLRERLSKLPALRRKKAVEGWKLFFEKEFLPDEGPDALLLLLETVREAALPAEALHVILPVMASRIELYEEKGEHDCIRLAGEITWHCQRRLAQGRNSAKRRRAGRKPLSRLWIIPTLILGFFVIALTGEHTERVKAKDVAAAAAVYLNEKYGTERYTAENLTAEKETLFGDGGDEIEYYFISEQDAVSELGCAIRGRESGDGEFSFFDNMQADEIRKAFADSINERTGHAEGQVLWDSETDYSTSGGIENGYFQTRYDGDFMSFIQSEAEARKDAPKTTDGYLSAAQSSVNGVCDYYLPDPAVKTMKEKLEGQDFPEDTELQAALNQCAADYQMQIRCVVLPESLFEAKLRGGGGTWSEIEMPHKGDVMPNSGLEPSDSFLMVTGWYVNMPPEDEKAMNIHSGLYTRETILMGEGIYGAENRISTNEFGLDMEWTAGSIQRVETPESLGLSEAERKKAVSFKLADGYALQQDCTLAIDKRKYGIADRGLRVFTTERHVEKTSNFEGFVEDYGDVANTLSGGIILDGEGYLFLEYPQAASADEALIVTFVNP